MTCPTEVAREPNVFREQMATLGYIEGSELKIEARSANGDVSRFADLVEGFVSQKVDTWW
jgi:hypothetical protein